METTEELTYIVQMSQRKDGNIIAASIIKEVSVQSLVTKENIELSTKYMKSWEMDPGEALGLFLSAKMTKNIYIMVRKNAKADGFNYYPSYNKIQEEKKSAILKILHLLLQKLEEKFIYNFYLIVLVKEFYK